MKQIFNQILPEPVSKPVHTKPSDIQAEKIQQIAQGKLPTPHQITQRVSSTEGRRGR